MNPVKDFLAEAKINPKLWNKLSIKVAFLVLFYGLLTYVIYYFSGMKYLGGENVSFVTLFVLQFIAALFVGFLRTMDDIKSQRIKDKTKNQL